MTVEGWVRRLARRLCDPDTQARLIDPILSDIELESRESVAAGRPWLARWRRSSGYVALCKAAALHGGRVCVRGLADEGAGRTIAVTLAAFVVLTAALILPPVAGGVRRPPPEVVLYLIPQALPLSIPVAVAFGIGCGWSRGLTARTMLRRIALLGIAGTAAALATMEWLVPDANQGFREMMIRQVGADRVHVARGINERSLSELAWLVRETSPERWRGHTDGAVSAALDELSMGRSPVTRQMLRLNLHLRLALSLATAALCLLAVAIATAIPRRNLARAVFAGAAVLYVQAYSGAAAAAPVLPAPIVGWLPNAAAVSFSLLLLGVSSRRISRRA